MLPITRRRRFICNDSASISAMVFPPSCLSCRTVLSPYLPRYVRHWYPTMTSDLAFLVVELTPGAPKFFASGPDWPCASPLSSNLHFAHAERWNAASGRFPYSYHPHYIVTTWKLLASHRKCSSPPILRLQCRTFPRIPSHPYLCSVWSVLLQCLLCRWRQNSLRNLILHVVEW